MATAVQGSFVGRTKAINTTQNAYGEVVNVVAASTTYSATGSNFSTAFMVHTGTNYTLTPVNGSGTIIGGTNPVTANEIHSIALSKVVTGGSTVVTLLR